MPCAKVELQYTPATMSLCQQKYKAASLGKAMTRPGRPALGSGLLEPPASATLALRGHGGRRLRDGLRIAQVAPAQRSQLLVEFVDQWNAVRNV